GPSARASSSRSATRSRRRFDVKIYLLDNGSIVIDHAQLMWNIGGGTPVRIPSYGLLIEHDDDLFLFDTGFDLEHTNAVLPFELPRGLQLFETPGHTIGHYSLLVTPDSGRPMVFAFDVVYTAEALEKGVQPGFHYDPVAGVRSIERVKQLAAEHEADIFFSHDMDAWNGYKHAPEFYEG